MFYPTGFFRQFCADQLLEALLGPRKFYPTQKFGHFWASSPLVTQNVNNPEHPNTRTPEHPNTQRPKDPKTQTGISRVFVKTSPAEGRRRFHQQTRTILFVPPLSFFVVFFLFVLCCFLCFLLFFVPWQFCLPPWLLTLWRVKKRGRGPKMAKIQYEAKRHT